MKRKAAFFDVDNTLLNLKSMFSFQQYYYARTGSGDAYPAFVQMLQDHPQRHDRQALNRLFYQSFSGRSQSVLRAIAEAWFAHQLGEYGDALWIRSALTLAGRLRAEGYQLVAVSGSSHEILAPLMRHLGFDACLATTLEVRDGFYTGQIDGLQMIGDGKGVAVRQYAAEQGIDLADCVACGDHITDLPMLFQTGLAFVVEGDPALEEVARQRDWPVLALNEQAQVAEAMHV
ncbi:HAD family hydrolase [Jeongeupia naejangsanensis]|uniref:HAD family phosphatase n=1 Tax=Jeongeupia naejangsanensis TaxID=613195 RepID=A0ABS2BK65_9NEIS|nr:HAD family phosphatase [Jeongeupia naejangsanensis]MBM3115835.1 HAD family phosphatase [Jeongeupia naejangsanensis]